MVVQIVVKMCQIVGTVFEIEGVVTDTVVVDIVVVDIVVWDTVVWDTVVVDIVVVDTVVVDTETVVVFGTMLETPAPEQKWFYRAASPSRWRMPLAEFTAAFSHTGWFASGRAMERSTRKSSNVFASMAEIDIYVSTQASEKLANYKNNIHGDQTNMKVGAKDDGTNINIVP
ncbi:hypothetical protein LXL04_018302 [Taraxacum kok-saghyz]